MNEHLKSIREFAEKALPEAERNRDAAKAAFDEFWKTGDRNEPGAIYRDHYKASRAHLLLSEIVRLTNPS